MIFEYFVLFVALRLHCFTSSNVGVSTAEDPRVDGCLWHCSSEKLVAKRSSQEMVVDGWRCKQPDRCFTLEVTRCCKDTSYVIFLKFTSPGLQGFKV